MCFKWDMPFLSLDQHHIHHMMQYWVFAPAFRAATLLALNHVSLNDGLRIGGTERLTHYFVCGTVKNKRRVVWLNAILIFDLLDGGMERKTMMHGLRNS